MNNTKIQGLHRPSISYLLLEPLFKLIDSCKVKSFFKKNNLQKTGDGHPVIIIPGFVGGRRSVNRLRKFLKESGYQSQVWQLEREVANSKNFHRLSNQIEKLFEVTKEPISILGWSLGGYYTRLLAKKHPEKIRQIITLNSPFNGGNVIKNAYWWFSLVYGGTKVGSLNKEWFYKLGEPISVPSTALFSKEDELAKWETCIETIEGERTQNIEVQGGHVGILFHENTLSILLDRLRQHKEGWARYKGKINKIKEMTLE